MAICAHWLLQHLYCSLVNTLYSVIEHINICVGMKQLLFLVTATMMSLNYFMTWLMPQELSGTYDDIMWPLNDVIMFTALLTWVPVSHLTSAAIHLIVFMRLKASMRIPHSKCWIIIHTSLTSLMLMLIIIWRGSMSMVLRWIMWSCDL